MKKIVVSSSSWFPQSGGLKVLHKLVDTLNVLGYDAYIAPSNPSGLGWHNTHLYTFNTPYDNVKLITQEVFENLNDAIVVYPESWYGNYLNAPNVVRWILGAANEEYMRDGQINSFRFDAWKDTDLWFWFSPLYKTKKFTSKFKNLDNDLTLIEFHRDIFKNKGGIRDINCWTLRKAASHIKEKDYIHEPDAIFFGDIDKNIYKDYTKLHVNPDYDFPGNYRRLADTFNRTNRFYSYDVYTFISIQALMCGADSIVVPDKNISIEDYMNGFEFHKYNAYGLDDLDRAKSIRNELDENITDFENRTINQIHTFVEKCNDYFK